MQYLMFSGRKLLVIHAVQDSMQFALHDSGKHGDIAARKHSDAELMSGNGPLVP
jgi:hypothetical protein